MYSMAVDTFVPMLSDLSAVLDKSAEHSVDKNIALPNARLAPDMFTLAQQVQIACGHAADGVSRLTDQQLPYFENNETTIDDLKTRIRQTIDHLERIQPAAFEGSEDRDCSIYLPNDKVISMNGLQFLRDWALPHFYFHVVTAYDILRHNGATISKQDYLAHVGSYIRPRG
jgi:hypothetical protein